MGKRRRISTDGFSEQAGFREPLSRKTVMQIKWQENRKSANKEHKKSEKSRRGNEGSERERDNTRHKRKEKEKL